MATSSKIYKEAAQYGVFSQMISSLILLLIALVLLAGGVYSLTKTDIPAQVVSVNTTNNTVVVSYNSGNTTVVQTRSFQVNDASQYKAGQHVYIRTDQNGQLTLSVFSSKVMGFMAIVAALFLVFVAWFNYYIARRFQFYAATLAVVSAVGMVFAATKL